jgi:hypothetical protein
MRRTKSNYRRAYAFYCIYEAKLCLLNLILLLFFSGETPLHSSATNGRLKVTRLLVESKADVAARTMCFSPPPPPPSHHLSLTALQRIERWLDCTHLRQEAKQSRRR